ncbi:MAG: NADH-quinone oxidoreductase subunit F [Dehalococcoidia bacterium]|nr:NADH-quinone oxidoreductase subunit F [Dehalococcoidia bacterium]MXY21869.1 NADH-quinone oxidoreductase subunit F [Dehalococcoidia bacterium]MYA62051.1 NADH-quinone oxidoreductase subunit F [Dehalococcoidia bacterium]
MPTYEEIKQTAEERWKDLTEGPEPWIRVCSAMCGHAAGAREAITALRNALESRGITARIDEVGCLGVCYADPLVDVLRPGTGSRLFFRNVTPDDIPAIVDSYIESGELPDDKVFGYLGEDPIDGASDLSEVTGIARQHRIALRNAGNIAPNDIYQYIANGGYAGLHKALTQMEPDDVIKEMTDSGLRGRGGAAFPTGIKWSFMVGSPGPRKYMLCNCEEGDPGAYNDKGILESDPHTLLEGLMIGGYATRASNGIVFIRHGHDGPIDRTEEAIRQAYEVGILGENIFGTDFSFDIEVALTGESYVAGEETALMEAIEGKRSQPRFRPPFPAAYGVWGYPSTINNVKTYSYAPEIISRGAEWFSSIGVNRSTGTAIICLNGNIEYPGLYEVPMGLTLGEVVNEIGGGVPDGKELKLLQTGGPLGGVLSAESMSIHIDFDEMRDAGAILGSGGIIVGDQDVCAVDLTRVLVAFCQFESCGKCFPCRLGMEHLLEITERIARCESKPGDLDLMRSVGNTMEASSLCGHGQLGFGPIRSALTHFEADFKAHIEERRCPTGSCLGPRIAPKNTRPYAHDFVPGAS